MDAALFVGSMTLKGRQFLRTEPLNQICIVHISLKPTWAIINGASLKYLKNESTYIFFI